ncbi:gamma-tubulin complex component 4-like [Python bivittatus]|uniref:Gamma-tubulin complex component 4-like n=1 Tax=Python bivittatus TaxID=176946 RepID=A0A9F2RDM5_PYTBI|nr:gamma-tubulin complex component 4-like [Python bivittatus]
MIVVEQIKTQKIHGCQILETVYKYSRGGLPPVRHALEKVLAMCHAVLYKQLSAWMLHGLLLDQHEEFFIRQGPSLGVISAQPEDDDDDLGIGGLTGKQLRELQDMIWMASTPLLFRRAMKIRLFTLAFGKEELRPLTSFHLACQPAVLYLLLILW